MTSPPGCRELLVFEDAAASLRALTDGLRESGCRVDVAEELDALLDTFVAAGGHRVALIAPEVPNVVAARAATSLTAVDPALRVVVFGHDTRSPGWPEVGVVRLAAHHPAARAALGAVLRVLATSDG